MKPTPNNPLLCDIGTGLCEMPDSTAANDHSAAPAGTTPLRIVYFTDPICSSCWGIEPALRRLKLEYGHQIEIEYRMGGLLPDWSYNSGGISKPSDVAHHWDEVSLHYDMPIDGDVWLEDPLDSSYPASIAFKAAQLQGHEEAVRYLRTVREMAFLRKINIAKWDNLMAAARETGLDAERFGRDYSGVAKSQFENDLGIAAQWGVRGFPTMFFVGGKGVPEKVYGVKPYSVYVDALHQKLPDAQRAPIDTHWESLFSKYPTLTSREFAELSQRGRQESETFLQELANAGHIAKLANKNGNLWMA